MILILLGKEQIMKFIHLVLLSFYIIAMIFADSSWAKNLTSEFDKLLDDGTIYWAEHTDDQICLNTIPSKPDDIHFGRGSLTFDWDYASVDEAGKLVLPLRKEKVAEKDFTQLGLDPRNSDVLIVKIGYLVPELYDLRGDWIMALTPGGVDQDLERLGYQRVQRPLFPLDKEFPNLNLKTRWIESSEQP